MGKNTIKGITIELDGSTVKLGKALKNILGESKSLEKQLKDVNKALQLDPHNTDLLATKQRILADQIENTAQHLEALRQAEAKAADSVKNFDAWEAAYMWEPWTVTGEAGAGRPVLPFRRTGGSPLTASAARRRTSSCVMPWQMI